MVALGWLIVTRGPRAVPPGVLSSTVPPSPGGAVTVSRVADAVVTRAISGPIRTTFTAVPRRWAVLAAKAAVTGAAALIAGELLTFACFFFTQAILSRHHRGLALSHPGALRAVLAAGFVLAACAVVGVGVGAVIRHTAGAMRRPSR